MSGFCLFCKFKNPMDRCYNTCNYS